MKNDLEIQVILFPEDAVLRGVIMRNGSRPRRIGLRRDAPRAHQLSCLRTILRQNVKFSFIACCAVLHNADREECSQAKWYKIKIFCLCLLLPALFLKVEELSNCAKCCQQN